MYQIIWKDNYNLKNHTIYIHYNEKMKKIYHIFLLISIQIPTGQWDYIQPISFRFKVIKDKLQIVIQQHIQQLHYN